MGLLLRAGQTLLVTAIVGAATPSCFSAGTGTNPPTSAFYFPTGLAVSPEGDVLYAINSDFDLQFSGGTLQSYDLARLRRDASVLIQANLSGSGRPNIPFINPAQWVAGCASGGLVPPPGVFLGQSCSPPVQSSGYIQHSVIVAAFATDLQVSVAASTKRRLFAPVRGVAALTWADVGLGADPKNPGDKFAISCGQGGDNRCDALHDTGNDPNQPGDSRQVTMPGEPFGMAQSADGTAIVVTHQTDTKVSLLLSGLVAPSSDAGSDAAVDAESDAGVDGGALDGAPDANGMPSEVSDPSMQFVLDGLPLGGVGLAAVPHDKSASVPPCQSPRDPPPCVRPAFLWTNHSTPEIDLLRYYDDALSSLGRPFIARERVFPIVSNALGIDSRGIAIDPTPRSACKAQVGDPNSTACAELPARVFFASRTPPALGIGAIGQTPLDGTGSYDPDLLTLTGNVPLPVGPSKVYLAPIVNLEGNLELRVFVVLFDSSQIAIYDPKQQMVESFVDVGPGPFAMAFDPFSLDDVGQGASAGDPDANGNRPYRYAYVASFTDSYVQMIDLDNAQPTGETFERVVYTLGLPTLPKGQ